MKRLSFIALTLAICCGDAMGYDKQLLTKFFETRKCSGCNLANANLSEKDLSNADLEKSNISGANFRRANLQEANFRHADLRGTDFTEANLRGANLTGARLRNAKLKYVDLTDANLTSADLRGADLTGALLSGANLRKAILKDTLMPPEYRDRLEELSWNNIQEIIGRSDNSDHILESLSGYLKMFPNGRRSQRARLMLEYFHSKSSELVRRKLEEERRGTLEKARRRRLEQERLESVARRQAIEYQQREHQALAHWFLEQKTALEALIDVNFAFNTPSHMAIGEVVGIHAVLSPSLTEVEMKERVEEKGIIEVHRLRSSSEMIATLSGIEFEIDPVGPQGQIVAHDTSAEWRWQIKAKRDGLHSLYLKLDAVVKIGEDGKKYHIETFKKEIKVLVAPLSVIEKIIDFVANFGGAIAAVGTAVAALYGGYLWLKDRRKRVADI